MTAIDHIAAPPDPLFLERAATTFVKAADAGLIDADELIWLLSRLRPAALSEGGSR